jgi:hypothetical protein
MGNLVRCLVDGDPFLGAHQTTPTGGRVVVIDNEMDRSKVRNWLRDQKITNRKNVAVFALRGKVATFDILDPRGLQEWGDKIRALAGEVLILDCLRPILDAFGLDENTDTGRVLVALDALVDAAGVSELIVVHHMGHNGERSRGSSRLRDWPDVEWKLVKEDPDDPSSRRYFSAHGRDVEVLESALDYDPATRRLTIAGGTGSPPPRRRWCRSWWGC